MYFLLNQGQILAEVQLYGGGKVSLLQGKSYPLGELNAKQISYYRHLQRIGLVLVKESSKEDQKQASRPAVSTSNKTSS